MIKGNETVGFQGIVSYGKQSKTPPACDIYKYTVFTRVASFQTWVADKLRDNYTKRDTNF